MCGICGEFSFGNDPKPQDIVEWESLVRLMRRRGPDSQGIWADSRCLLAACRLSIVDPSPAANQPMFSSNLRYAIVFNGELYNFQEIRRELRILGVQFCTAGDTEVVLQALIAWGATALDRFNGMFALAFYDLAQKTLLLARDHAGMKPLYYALTKNSVIFASQYDQIVLHPAMKNCGLSLEALVEYLRLGFIAAPRALVQSTFAVEPGCWVLFDRDGFRERGRHFNFRQDVDLNSETDGLEYRIEETLVRAMKRHTICDCRMGCLLSGGIDSPLLASILRETVPYRIPAFTAGWNVPAIDESKDATEYANSIGVDLYLQNMGSLAPDALVDEVLDACTEPLADEGAIPALAISRLASTKVKVVISGDGADELFWGYTPRQMEFMNTLDTGRTTAFKRYFARHSAFTEDEFWTCFPESKRLSCEQTESEVARVNADAFDLRQFEFDSYLPKILLKADRAAMHHSVEVRMPFLDREVIELASHLHWRRCLDMQAQVGKKPLRSLLLRRTGKVTDGKRGFTAPIGEWIRTALFERFREACYGVTDLKGFPVNTEALNRVWESHQLRLANRGLVLWRIFILREWLKKYHSLSA